MAVYEFECQACGERFQVHAKMKEHDQLMEHPPKCPKCGQQKTHQLVSDFSCKTPTGY